MRNLILISLIFLMACSKHESEISHLRCEYLENPISIDVSAPRFIWECNVPVLDYRIEVASSIELLKKNKPDMWKSDKNFDRSNLLTYKGKKLNSHSTYYWRVMVTGEKGNQIKSTIARFETTKFSNADWSAEWISDGLPKEHKPSPIFRKEFFIEKKVDKARLYVSGLGYFEVFLEGQKVGINSLDPGYTDFSKRVLYLTHDVTELLNKGTNIISAILGNGWFNMQSIAVWNFDMAHWRRRPQLIAELHIDYTDGTKEIIVTDEHWKTSTGAYLMNSLYSGDTYDARLEKSGWKKTDFDDSGWKQSVVVDSPAPLLVSQSMPAIQCSKEYKPVRMKTFGPQLYVFDMGVNLAGVCRLKIEGKAGTKITLKHGEKIDADGRVDQSNLTIHYKPNRNRFPVPEVDPNDKFQTDTYILKGDGIEIFTPSFTYHGFQYVEVESSEPVDLQKEDLTALFIHTNVKQTGSFTCSNDLLNKIWVATRQSYLSNLHAIPTDCPQREKNGWTADGWISMDFGMQNFDAISVYEKWVNDMVDNIDDRGFINCIIPSAGWDLGFGCGPVWAGAMFFVPEKIHQYYGDLKAIEKIYPVCERYLDFLQTQEKDGILDHGLGDWVFYKTATPNKFTSTAIYFEECRIMSKFSQLLGKDPSDYEAKATELLETLNRQFFNSDQLIYANGSQAAMAMALYLDIVPKEYIEKVAAKLYAIIKDNDFQIDFGMLGSKYMLPVLQKFGYMDAAYRFITNEDIPSWGAFIKNGYTTLPESWNVSSASKDASLNHIFLGDVSAWMTKALAGINFDDEYRGYSHIIIKPEFVEELDWVESEYHSVKGLIRSEWKREGDNIILDITIPHLCTATIYTDKAIEVEGGTHQFIFTK